MLRTSTSTGRIMQEIGELAIQEGWKSFIAYSKGRDGIRPCRSSLVPVGNKGSVFWHGLETRLFDRHGLASVKATRQLIDRINQIRPDVIHIHNIHGYFLNYRILFEFLSKCAIPVVWTVHDCWLYTGHCYYYSFIGCEKWQTGCYDCPQKKEFPTSWFFDRSRQNYTDKKRFFTSLPHSQITLVAVSDWMRNEMQKSFFKSYDIHVIHNGINTETFHICPPQSTTVKYGLSGKHVILGVASIWSKEKGLNDFIRMAGLLKDDEAIVLVGVKPEEQKTLPDNIIAIRRTENAHELAELYSSADAFANPTWQDNYPTVNMEAMACGTPVITYRTGGSVEAVTEQTGFVIEQGDITGILEAFRHIKRQGKDSYQEPCRNHALTHFRKEDRYADYISLYEHLIDRR